MKKYKLIKEYPGSPKLGIIASTEYSNCGGIGIKELPGWMVGITYLDNFKEFWQEIIEPAKAEKDYEILTIRDKNHIEFIYDKKDPSFDLYIQFEKTNHGFLEIHSVKRLCDGEVFTIGDKVNYGNNRSFIIGSFTIDKYNNNHKLMASEHGKSHDDTEWCTITKLKHVRKPLFTTKDGVDIYEGEKFFYLNGFNLNEFNEITVAFASKYILYKGDKTKRFSTKKAAEDYIIMNKPCLSYNDVLSTVCFSPNDKLLLKETIKFKLNL